MATADPVLTQIAKFSMSQSLSLTVITNGVLITGTAIPAQQYRDEVVEGWDPEFGEGALSEIIKILDSMPEEPAGTYLYFMPARTLSPTDPDWRPMPIGPWVRVRVESVDAWFLGEMSRGDEDVDQ